MAITQTQLKNLIEAAFDDEADVTVNPAEARGRVAEKLAAAFFAAMIGRQTSVTGTASGGSTITGTGIIQ